MFVKTRTSLWLATTNVGMAPVVVVAILWLCCCHVTDGNNINIDPVENRPGPSPAYVFGQMGLKCRDIPLDLTDVQYVYKWPLSETEREPKHYPPHIDFRDWLRCFVNIDECANGYTAAFNITTDHKVLLGNTTDFEIIPAMYDIEKKTKLRTTSVSLRMRVNQAEFSGSFSVVVSQDDQRWEMTFRVALGYPMLIQLTWRKDVGLDVYVDGICVGFMEKPFRVTAGDERTENIESLSAASVWMMDGLRSIDGMFPDIEDFLATFYLGCLKMADVDDAWFSETQTHTMPQNRIVSLCRQVCWDGQFLLAVVGGSTCRCGIQVPVSGHLDASSYCGLTCREFESLPCGSESEFMGVYLTSSVIRGNGISNRNKNRDDVYQAIDISDNNAYVLHRHRGRRLSSITDMTQDEDSDVGHHRYRRSSLEFIEIDDAVGLAGDLTCVNYLLHTEQSQLSCTWEFGDLFEVQYDAEHQTQICHVFTTAGLFEINATCGSPVIQDTARALIKSPIRGCDFTMVQTGNAQTPSDEVILTVTQDSGSDVIGAIFIMDEEGIAFTNPLDITWRGGEYGVFSVNASISNGFDDNCILSANVTVGEPITGLKVRSTDKLVTNRPIEISVEVDQGTAVTVSVTFSDDNQVLQETLADYSATWTKWFSSPGRIYINANATNFFGSDRIETHILITNSIEGLVLTVAPYAVDIGDNVRVTLTGSNASAPLNDVSCTIFTGDGRNVTQNATTLDATYVFVVEYSYAEEYEQGVLVSAECQHADSTAIVTQWVSVGKRITSCSIRFPVTQIISVEVDMVISVIGGYDIIVEIDFGDKDTEDFLLDIPGDFNVSHTYSKLEPYHIKATATSGNLSSGVCACDTGNHETILILKSAPDDHLFNFTATPAIIDITSPQRVNFELLKSDQNQNKEMKERYVRFLFSDDYNCSLSMTFIEKTVEMNAVYDLNGTYTVTAFIRVAKKTSVVKRSVEVTVMYPIQDFTINVSTTALHVGESVEVDVYPLSNTSLKIVVKWGDRKTDSYLWSPHSRESTRFVHSYAFARKYHICVSVDNGVESKPQPRCQSVKVLNPMVGIMLNSFPLLVLQPRRSYFRIELQPGVKRPTDMSCTLDRGDGKNPLTFDDNDLVLPLDVQMSYPVTCQNYRAKLKCRNILGYLESTQVVQVKKPLSDIFILEVVQPFYWLDYLGTTVEYILSIREGENIPLGDAELEWIFGDGFNATFQKQIVDRENLQTHNFTVPGNYTTKLIMSYGKWSDNLMVSFTVARQQLVSIAMALQSEVDNQTFGDQTWFEVNKLIEFSPSPVETDAKYTWETGTVTETGATFEHEYSSVGVYAIRLNIQHHLSFQSITEYVHITSNFTSDRISIVDVGGKNITLKAYSILNVMLEGKGLNSPLCIFWVFCNDTLYVSGPPRCYNGPYDTLDPGLAWGSDTKTITYMEFNFPGEYNISIIASNNVHENITQMTTAVITGCRAPPKVTIKGSVKDIAQARRHQRSEYITLTATVVMTCYGLQVAPVFQWYAKIGTTNTTALDSDNSPSFMFPPRTFEVGTYNISMKVTITETTPILSGMDYMFMNITPGPLVVTITGGSARTVNMAKEITFDASESEDLDEVTQDRTKWQFLWKCLRVYASGYIPTPGNNSVCDSPNYVTISGENGSSLTLPPYTLNVDATYRIHVTAKYNGKNGTAEQSIDTINRDPVQASMRCVINCLMKVNPTSMTSYQASCDNCNSSTTTPEYRWELYSRGSDNSEVKIDLAELTDTGFRQSGMVIKAGALKGSQSYSLRVVVMAEGFATGFTEVAFYTNVPPFSGSCNIWPRSGHALSTAFKVTFAGWLDEGDEPRYPGPNDKPLSYQPVLRYRVQYRPRSADTYIQLVPIGEAAVISNLKFAIGPEAHDYIFELLFTVLDKYGGIAECNDIVQVKPKEIEKEDLDIMLQTEGDLDQLIQSKDAEGGIRALVAIVSVTDAANLTVADAEDVKNKLVDFVSVMGLLTNTADNVNMAAGAFADLYKYGTISPDENATMSAVTSVDVMASALADLSAQSAEDIKRTADSLFHACGSIMNTSFPIYQPIVGPETNNTLASNHSSGDTGDTDPEYMEWLMKVVNGYQSKNISGKLLETISFISDQILTSQVAGQAPSTSKASTLEVRLQVNSPKDFSNSSVLALNTKVNLPDGESLFSEEFGQELIEMKLISFPEANPYSYGANSSDINSGVTSLEFQTKDERKKVLITESEQPISFIFETRQHQVPKTHRVVADFSAETPMSYHRVEIKANDTDLRVLVTWDDPNWEAGLWVFAKLLKPPLKTSFDLVQWLPQNVTRDTWHTEEEIDEAKHTFVMTEDQHCGPGLYLIGVMLAGSAEEFETLESSTSCAWTPENLTFTLPRGTDLRVTRFSYNITFITSGCRYFNVTTEEWLRDGCKTGPKTNRFQRECLCTHLTSFGASFYVQPNIIDFSTVFTKSLFENFAVMGTIISFTSLYVLLLFYARRKDRHDICKWGVTPLSDNRRSYKYAYQITVETGVRPGSGTKSRVFIKVSGEDADTGGRVLDDSKRPIFQAGSVNSFLMLTPRPLGLLSYVRVWHDNSGGGGQAGWFLSKISVVDLQTGKEFYFLCEQWLAVEQGDGSVDRTLSVASKKDLLKIGHLVYTGGRKNLSDQHLWFSLFSRPTRSSFNRCQRLCCCLTLLYTSMIANAMFYQTEDTGAPAASIKLGSMVITTKELYIGFISCLIVTPVNMMLVQIFRKARPLGQEDPDPFIHWLKKVARALTCGLCSGTRDVVDQYDLEERRHEVAAAPDKETGCDSNQANSEQPPPDKASAAPPAAESVKEVPVKKYQLPHWSVHVAYCLAFVACFLSCFFCVLYSLDWGKEMAEKWLLSMMTSFFSSAFLIQPMKVLVIVFIVSIIFKKPSKMTEEVAENLNNPSVNDLQADEEYIHDDKTTTEKVQEELPPRPKTPPSREQLEEARKERLRDVQAKGVVRDSVLYALFLLVVLFLCYTNRDPDAYFMSESIRNIFVSDHVDYLIDNKSQPLRFSTLSHSTPTAFWDYVDQTLVPGLYGDRYYNGKDMHWRQKNYIRDWQGYRVGPGRLRQLRVKPESCKISAKMEHVIDDCTKDYSSTAAEERSFNESWIYSQNTTLEHIPSYLTNGVDKTTPWTHQSSNDLDILPYTSHINTYGGGGYVAELGTTYTQAMDTSQYLGQHGWYDRYTRAIFIEFSVYNANVNLFSVVTLLVETPTFGGGLTSHAVHTFRLYHYAGGIWIISLGLQGIFCMYLVYFLCNFLYQLKKEGQKVLQDFWMLLELSLLLVGVAAVGMFAARELFIASAIKELKESKERSFVSFSHIAKWDEVFGYLMAILSFIAILRFMRVLRFSTRVTTVARSLHNIVWDVFYFMIVWSIILVAFATWGYVVFMRSVTDFSTFQGVLESLLGMMIGSFDFCALQSAEKIIGPIYFSLYIFVAYFLLANMLITIIVGAFCKEKAKSEEENDETFRFTEYMMKKFKTMLTRYDIGTNAIGPAKGDTQNAEKDQDDDITNCDDVMTTMEKRIDEFVASVIKNYGVEMKESGQREGPPDSKEDVDQRKKIRKICISL